MVSYLTKKKVETAKNEADTSWKAGFFGSSNTSTALSAKEANEI